MSAASKHAAGPLLQLEAVRKSFGPKHVLRGVDLDIAEGESLVILGPSGCGKSVTIKCVLSLVEADAGAIRFHGQEMNAKTVSTLRERSGMLFQSAALFDSLPVWRNVAFRLLQSGISKAEARAAAIDCLRRVGLGEATADLSPAELSGGMQKRVGLARAVASDPEVLFFDEPTTGLDPILAQVVSRLIRSLVQETGATAITITHDLASARIIGSRVAMLHEGVVQWQGPMDALESSGNPCVEQFVAGLPEGPIPTVR